MAMSSAARASTPLDLAAAFPPGADGGDGEAPFSPRSDSSSVVSSVAASPFSSGRYDSDRHCLSSEIEEIPSGRWLSPSSPCSPPAPNWPEGTLVGGATVRGKNMQETVQIFVGLTATAC
ncbi:hypothetical protein Taro_031383 [Colocasia esculenta]|uniref:Uncharacterized protein n=1 Tax=Colocasia esculenta TaxID=4460 RepID=A0A843VUH6_COLES|nr:hypothetical protein [Colocasia esculenta]